MSSDQTANGDNTILLNLAKVLDAEIKSKQLEKTIPNDFAFAIHDDPNDTILKRAFVGRYSDDRLSGEIFLAREFDGEKVLVMVEMPSFNRGQQYVELVVKIYKKLGVESTFNVSASEEITVKSMKVKVPSHDDFYEDPKYYAVDKNSELHHGLREYLRMRGIDKSATDYLYKYMLMKSKNQPITVLKDVQEFLKN